ncbi:hypothetical protein Tco_0874610 [Tanacetum coccineum]|uniref:Uncharacterized protein n=1 Tax=Tanacetum coccineum TaxID=301880 RepID=A0ABQ5BNT5_9ASTR
MSNLKFVETYNLVAFWEKPKESDGFKGITDFLNASSIRYALTVNPTIYTSCIKKLWATTKAKTVNGEMQIQALVDRKKVIVVELEEEEKLAKQREEDANIAEWDNSKLFVELMDKRKKHFARLRAEEQRRKPPTKAQKRYQMCTYLKNITGFTHSQLKNKSFDEVQKDFDKTMGWIDSFVSIDSEVVKGGKEKDEGSVTRAEENSSKRAGTKLEQERIKKQKMDDDQEEAEMKKHMEIVVDEEEIAVDAIPLATKPLIIVDWKIIKERKMGYF